MVNINLLPWREQLRAQRMRDFGLLVLFAALLTAGGVFGWYKYNEGLIDYQNRRNHFLEREIAKVDKQIKEIRDLEKIRKQLIARMKVVADLQSQRPLAVHLFDELVTTLPEGIYLSSMVQKGLSITVKGRAESNARVSAYMRNIDASPWLTKPVLRIIEQKGDKDASPTFSLVMKQVVPKREDEK